MPHTSPAPARAAEPEPPAPAAISPRAVTLRAVAIGLALVPFLCWWSLKHELIHGGSEFVEAALDIDVYMFFPG